MKWIRDASYLAARILLVGIFLFSGIRKLLGVTDTTAEIAALGLPFPALAAVGAGVVELVCSFFLLLNFKNRLAAIILLLFVAPATVLFEGPFRGEEGALLSFLKNLAIMGGLLLVVVVEWRRSGGENEGNSWGFGEAISWIGRKTQTCIRGFEPWGIVIALIGLLLGFVGFMIEAEDRQAERIFRAWEVVYATTKDLPENNRSRENARGQGIVRALEYLNRNFSGLFCSPRIATLLKSTTGNEFRSCVIPKKRRAWFGNIDLTHLDLSFVRLPNAKLQQARFQSVSLSCANLNGADLSYANLQDARLWATDFRNSTLKGTDFRGASLCLPALVSPLLSAVSWQFLCVDLRGVKELTCEQLQAAKNWEHAIRDDQLKCGAEAELPAPIPQSLVEFYCDLARR